MAHIKHSQSAIGIHLKLLPTELFGEDIAYS